LFAIAAAHGMHSEREFDPPRRRIAQCRQTEQETAMIVTVFRSRLVPGLQEEYVALVDQMQKIARTIPGYISHKGFWAEDGERVTIVEFEHEEGQRAWRMHPEHVKAQREGRLKYYSEYDIKVCDVKHANAFKRDEKRTANG
jgi:heme-degrading monooxygenase HmoA